MTSAEMAVADDPPVLDLDPGPQLVGEPDRVGGQQLVETLQPVRRRQVPLANPRSTASFPTPRIASNGIQDSDVTQDSTRVMQALPSGRRPPPGWHTRRALSPRYTQIPPMPRCPACTG
jgi:hypothetical protein